ncbi:hypothetical protein CDAR_22221 [Caerostris darwini]|uniref:Uncharacterized protein n=1 Tax=Caerostris darwini TaxID=1538125 RepID=A0AAV4USS0_9ARAC|nr:hypothetical protein CDAR_22221 [Caerostris darwini]
MRTLTSSFPSQKHSFLINNNPPKPIRGIKTESEPPPLSRVITTVSSSPPSGQVEFLRNTLSLSFQPERKITEGSLAATQKAGGQQPDSGAGRSFPGRAIGISFSGWTRYI